MRANVGSYESLRLPAVNTVGEYHELQGVVGTPKRFQVFYEPYSGENLF